jgi:hypothetical protein
MKNRSTELDGAGRVIMGTTIGMLEIGSRLNRRWNDYRNARFLEVFGGIPLFVRNLIIPLNRSHQVVLGAVLERL